MISHAHRAVFVHVPKAAGTSIERAFVADLGLNWNERDQLLLRVRNCPTEGPPRLAHLTAAEYVQCGHIRADAWQQYFTFSFVRNPYSRAVSMYKYLGAHRELPFPSFVTDRLAASLWRDQYWFVRPQAEFVYGDDGDLLVDFVGRTEDVADGFAHVCDAAGLARRSLPHTNSSERRPWQPKARRHFLDPPRLIRESLNQVRFAPKGRNYAQYYDDQAKETIDRLYGRDLEIFGYCFEEQPRA